MRQSVAMKIVSIVGETLMKLAKNTLTEFIK